MRRILMVVSIITSDAFFCFGFIVTTTPCLFRKAGNDGHCEASSGSSCTRCCPLQEENANRYNNTSQRDNVIISGDGLKFNTKLTIVGSIAKGERRAHERSVGQQRRRQLCNRCHRPLVQCVCASLPPNKIVTPHTNILILQHPTEFRRQTFSTVPLVLLVLQNAQVFVGHKFDLQIPLIQKAIQEHRQLLLLYPGSNAVDLNDPEARQRLLSLHGIKTKPSSVGTNEADLSLDNLATTEERSLPSSTPKNLLILVDGTWTQAQRLIKYSPDLVNACQQVQFTSSNVTSIYNDIRKEPNAHCLSTLEAVAQALVVLESSPPPNDILVASLASHHLHAALQSLVKIQLQYYTSVATSRHHDVTPSVGSSFNNNKQRPKKSEERKQRRLLQLEDELFGKVVSMHSDNNNRPNTHNNNDSHKVTTFEQEAPNENPSDCRGILDPKRSNMDSIALLSKGTDDVDDMLSSTTTISIQLSDGSTLRPLETRDAQFIDSRWPHRSSKSLRMISQRLSLANNKSSYQQQHQPNCCLGIFGPVNENENDMDDDDDEDAPRAFILQYEDGSLGILHVEEAHRRKGYGSLLLQQATQQLHLAACARAQQQVGHGNASRVVEISAFIIDGNTASEGLFTKQGWKREDDDPATGLKKKRGTGKRRAKRKWIKELNL